MTTSPLTRIFLSYSRSDDEPFVKRLHDDLTQANFFQVAIVKGVSYE